MLVENARKVARKTKKNAWHRILSRKGRALASIGFGGVRF